MTTQQLLTIKDAAYYLSVSTKTLRRWEKKGLFSAVRTSGGHRRYSLQALVDFKKNKNKKVQALRSSFFEAPGETSSFLSPSKKNGELRNLLAAKVGRDDLRQDLSLVYQVLPKTSKRIFKFSLVILFLIFSVSFLSGLKINSEKILGKVSLFLPFAKNEVNKIESLKESIKSAQNVSDVLAATSFQNVSFNVYIESIFRDDVSFLQNASVEGTLDLIGNTLTSADDLNITPGGGGITIGDGTATIDLAGGDLFVTDELEVGSDATVGGDADITGDASIGSLTINSETFTDLTGTGLTLSNGVLTVTLGTSIDSSEITDDTIKEVDLNISNSPTNTFLLTYNSSTSGFTWVDPAATGAWVDDGTLVRLTTSSDNVTVGSATSLAKLGVDGDTDEIQLLVQGNSTQTTNLLVLEQSSGTDVFSVSNTGVVTLLDGGLLDLSGITHNDSAAQGLRLPQAASFTNMSSGEGYLAWDTDNDALAYYDGSTWNLVSGGGITGSGTAGYVTFWSSGSAVTGESTYFWDSTNDLLGIGTGSPSSKLHVTGTNSTNPLVLLNETGTNDIIQGQVSSSTLFRVTNAGNVLLTGTLNTVSGNLTINSAGGTTTIDDIVNLGSSTTGVNVTTAGVVSDADGNLVLGDTVDIGSATTGIRVTTAGDISDIDGNLSISDNTDITGNLDVSGTLTSGTANAFTVNASGQITTATNATINDIDISTTGAVSDAESLALTTAGNSWSSAGNLTISGDLAVNGGDITTTATGLNIDVANTGTFFFRDGTNNLFRILDGGAFGTVLLTTAASQPATCTEGELYADDNGNLYYCEATNTWVDITQTGGNVSGSAASGQVAYWTGSSTIAGNNNFFLDTTNFLLGVGTNAPAHRLHVTTGYAGNALAVFNETLGNDILVASASSTTRVRITNAGNIYLTGTLNTVSGNLIIDSAGGSTTVSDNFVVTGTSDLQGNVSDSGGNLVLDDTVDIGSATSGINVTTAGVISDIDGNVSISDNTDITGALDVSSTLTVGSSNQFQVDASGNVTTTGTITAATDETINGIDISAAAVSDIVSLTLTTAGNSWTSSALTVGVTLDANGQVDLGDGGDTIAVSGTTLSLTSNGATNDITATSADDIIFDDLQLSSPIQMTDVDTSLPNSNLGIVDAINDAWNAAIGGGGGLWTLSSGTVYPTTITNRVGIGTTTAANIISMLYVTNDSTATGKSVAIFNQTESEDILTASASGTPRLTLTSAGNLQFHQASSITTTTGNLTLDSAGSTVFADDLSWTDASPTLTLNNGVTFNIFDGTQNLLTLTDQGATADLTISGDLTVSGGDITSAAAANLLNTVSTTINFGSAATTLNIADAAITGTIDIGGVTADGATTINIATNGTSADTIAIGNSTAATTLALTGGDDWSVTTTGIGTFTQVNVDNLRLDANTFSSTSGDITIDAFDGNVLSGDAFNVGGAAAAAYNYFATSIAGVTIADGVSDLYIEDEFEVDGNVVIGSANTDTLTINAGSSGTGITFADVSFQTCTALETNASGVLVCGSDAGTGANYWQLSSNTLSPGNDAADTDRMVVGGPDTTVFQLEVNGTQAGKALVSLNDTGTDQNIFTASASGTTVLNIDRSGNVSFINQADARFYDSDGSNYTGFQAPSNLTTNPLYTLPTGTFTADYVLTWQSGDVLEWKLVTGVGGAGDITDVGDVTSGAAFVAGCASNCNNLWFEGTTADGFEVQLTSEDATYDALITFPAETGEVALLQPDSVQTATKSGSLLWFNETGGSTPNLVELEVGGTDTFTVQNDGDIITTGDAAINGGNITSSVDLDINATGGDVTTPNRLTVGTATAGPAKLNVDGMEAGYALSILNYTGTDQNILVASNSGAFRFAIQFDGDLELRNAETIDNQTDDFISFTGLGGADNTDLRLDLDGTLPVLDSATDTAIGIDDDLTFIGAQQITTSTGDLTIAPAGNLVINTTGGTVDIDDPTINLATQATDFEIADNTASALTISEGSNNYLLITTTNDNEVVTLDLPVGGATSLTGNLFISNITKTINLGTGTAADTINIGTGGTTADDINIGGLATSNLDITGVTDIGDGGSTNFARFSATGDLTFFGTGDTVTGPGTDLFTITNAGDTTISATGAGNDLLMSAADELDLTSTGLMDVNAGANLDIDVTGTFDVLSTGVFSIDGTGASNVSATAGNLTLSTITSGDLILTSAGAVDVNSSAGVTIDSGSGGTADIALTAIDDIIFDDGTTSGTIPFTDDDVALVTPTNAIIDAINEAYNAAVGGGGGPWTLSGSTVYPTQASYRIGIGTVTTGDIISKLFVDNDSTATGKALAIFNQTESQDILTASASGTPRLTLTNAGNLQFHQASSITTTTGDLTLNSTGGTTTVDDNLVVTGTSDLQGNVSDSGGNLILDDTVDIGSATTGIRISTTGDISDIDGDITISDNTGITGNLDVSGTLTSGTSNAFQVDASGNISSTGTTGITLSGSGADLSFTGGGTNIISSTGTLQIDAFTLGGAVTGNSQTISGLGTLTFGAGNVNITGSTIGLTTDTDLLQLAANILTVNGDIRTADTFTLEVGGLTGIAYNAFANSTEAPEEAAISSDNDLYVGGDVEIDGTLYSNSVAGSYTQGSVIFAGASGVLTQDNANFFFDDTNNLLGLGTNVPIHKLQVVGAITGKALVVFNETGDQDILAASSSSTTVARITNAGNIYLTGTLNTVSGDLTIDSAGGTTTIDDAVNLGSSTTGVAVTTAGLISDIDGNLVLDDTVDIGTVATGIRVSSTDGNIIDIDGNLVLNDTVDIGSATTGLRVDTDGVILDIDDVAVSVNDNLSVTGDLTVTGGDINGPSGENLDLGEATADTITLYIAGTAEVLFNGTTIYPQTTNDISFGNAINRFADLYLDGGNINLYSATDVDILDNSATAFTITEASNNYLSISTLNTTEHIEFGTTSLAGLTYEFAGIDCSGFANGGVITTDTSGNLVCTADDGGAGGGGVSPVGTPVAGQVTYWASASTIAGNSDFWWDNSNEKVGIGTGGAPDAKFQISGDAIGKALAILNTTSTDQNILVASASGTQVFALDRTGQITITPGSALTTGIDVTDTDLVNAISLGQNFALFDGVRAFSPSSGQVTFEDTSGNDFVYLKSSGLSGGILAIDPSTSAPATCTVGEIYSDTSNIYYCEATNTWVDLTVQGGAQLWQLNSMVLSPIDIQYDLAIGGTATSSASFIAYGVETAAGGVADITSDVTTTGDVFGITSSTLQTGSLLNLNTGSSNTLTTGTLLDVSSTATSLTTAGDAFLGYFNWNPGSTTTATGDLVRINIGTNGNVTNLLNITDAGSTLFRVSETQIESAIPHNFTSPGDVGFAYDAVFTNQTAAYIKSLGPLYIQVGESFESNNLTLQTYNSGRVLGDVTGLGGMSVSSNVSGITPQGLLQVDGASTGKALTVFNETGDQNILTASDSGTTRLNLTGAGQLELLTDGSTAGLTLGAGEDLAMYHDGTDTTIDNNTGLLNVISASNINFQADNDTTDYLYLDTASDLPQFFWETGMTTNDAGFTISASDDTGQLQYRDQNSATWVSFDDFTTGGGTNLWQLNAEVVSPGNSTYDVAVGGTATSSASFIAYGVETAAGGVADITSDVTTTGDVFGITSSTLQTGSLLNLNTGSSNTLTTGTLLQVETTATSLTTAGDAFLGYYNWNPGSTTTATGDLVRINIGTNGNVTNLLNITDNGSTLFRVAETQIESAVPHLFSAAGDVSFSYDAIFTNQTASKIESYGPFTIEVGEVFESNDLTFKLYNSGQAIFDTTGLGGVGISSNVGGATLDGLLQVDGAKTGKALVILNEAGNQNIISASASGTTVFNLARTGAVSIDPTATGTFLDFELATQWTSGDLVNADWASATTQTAALTGINLDFTNLTSVASSTTYGLLINDLAAQTTSTEYAIYQEGANWDFGGYFEDDLATLNDLYVGATTETLANTGFVIDGDDAFVAGMMGVEGNIYTDGSFIAGTTLTLSDASIAESGDLNLQPDADSDDYFYLDTTSDIPSLFWETGMTTNDAGFSISASDDTGQLQYRDQDSATWVSFDDFTTGGGTNLWQLNTQVVSPGNSTYDVAVGGTATSSASFIAYGVETAAGGVADITSDVTTTGDVFGITSSTLQTGSLLNLNTGSSNTLTTGTLLDVATTATSLTTAGDAFLGYFNWNPGSSTTATGDLIGINIGTNGNVTNLLNITDAGSTLFRVSETQIESAVPHSFTAAGDVTIAYDIQFTNQTASYIKSKAPLYLQAGEAFENNNLIAQTYGVGTFLIEKAATTADQGTTDSLATIYMSTPIDTTGTNVHQGLYIDPVIGNATGGTNTVNLIATNAVTGDAQVTLNAINIGALTGTAATEIGINIGTGWDTQAAFSTSIGSEALDITTVSGVRTVAAIDLNENNTTGTVPTIVWDSAETRGGFLQLNPSGALATENLIDINTTGAFTSNLLDITSGAQTASGNYFDVNVGNAAQTGDIFNVDIPANAVGLQTFVVSDAAISSTAGFIMDIDTSEAWTGNMFDITTGAQAWTGNIFDVNVGAAASTGDVMNISMGSSNLAGGAFVVADAGGARTDAIIDITSASTASTDAGSIMQINSTGLLATGANVLDINMSGGASGNVLDITTSSSATSGNLIDLNFGNIADTGDGINISMGAAAVGAQALVISNSAVSTVNQIDITADSLTTANIFNASADGLTSGSLMFMESTSTSTTAPTNARLGYFNWDPGSSTTISGDLFKINIGTSGNVTNVFNVTDAGSTLFSVAETGITSAVPHSFTAAGDVTIAYDLLFSNQTASFIKSNAPLTIEAGESFESNNLTLKTYGTGDIVFDNDGAGTGILTDTGQLGLGTTIPDGKLHVTGAAIGKALTILNETGDQNILAASSSGSTILTLARNPATTAPSVNYLTLQPSLTVMDGSDTQRGIFVDLTNADHTTGSNILYGLDIDTITGDAETTETAVNINGGWDTGLAVSSGTVTTAIDLSGTSSTTDLILDDGLTIAQTSDNDLDIVEGGLTLNLDFAETTASTITTSSASALDYIVSGDEGFTFTSSETAGTTTTSAFVFDATAITTGTGLYAVSDSITQGNLLQIATSVGADTLTSGNLLQVSSDLANSTFTGNLAYIDWSPDGSTEIFNTTADLLQINAGQYANVGNLLNITDNGSAVFTVSQTAITSALPHSFTAAGDVSIAYDLLFTNQTASYLKSNAPLYIQAGEITESNNLTLQTYNSGRIIGDITALGGMTLSSNIGGATPHGLLQVDGFSTGKAMAIFNTTSTDQNILSASQSGTTVFNLGRTGALSVDPTTTGTFLDFELATEWDFGTLINADFGAANTQGAGDIIGTLLNFNTNLTGAADRDVTGYEVRTPALTASTAVTTNYIGFNLPTAGALTQDTAAGTINWRGLDILSPVATANFAGSAVNVDGARIRVDDITQTAGTMTANGLFIDLTSANIITGGTLRGIHIDGLDSESVGTVTAINIDNMTAGAATEIGINVGTGWDIGIQASSGIAIGAQQTLTADSATPSVAGGSHWITGNSNPTSYTNFTSGTTGQFLVIEVNDAFSTFDCAGSEATINCGLTDLTAAAGDILTWVRDATIWNLITWMDESVTQTGADLAELFVSSENLTAGDVVSANASQSLVIKKSQGKYDNKILGIVSTQPGFVLQDGPAGENSYPVALSGRVPVKVSTENGLIKVGDPLTSSSIPGVAMKATNEGLIIGTALENYESPEIGKVTVFVNRTWFDPNLQLTDTGDFQIVTSENSRTTNYELRTISNGNLVDQVGVFAKLIVANIKAGYSEVNQLISKGAKIDKLQTGIISPLPDSDLVIDLRNTPEVKDAPTSGVESGFGKLLVKGVYGEVVFGVDEFGNATASGELASDTLKTNDATISGELRVGKIYADEIVGQITLEQIEALLADAEINQGLLAESQSWSPSPTTLTTLNELALENLYVTGSAAVDFLSVTESVVIGNDLVINTTSEVKNSNTSEVSAGTSIDTLSAPLSIQSSASQPLYLMAGLVQVDTQGNVQIAGDLAVGGNISSSGLVLKSSTEVLRSDSSDGGSSGFGKLLSIINKQGDEVGSISATGAAEFVSVTADTFAVTEDPTATASATFAGLVYRSEASAGTAKVPSGSREVTISNPNVNASTLIFVTPTSQASGPIFVKEQSDGKFVVGFSSATTIDVTFNWWLVDVVAKNTGGTGI